MSTVAGFPGLSGLLAWPTEHLTEAADYWEAVGGRSYGVAKHVWRDAVAIDWHGEAADALRTATHAAMLTTSAVADQLQAAAKVARSGLQICMRPAHECGTRSKTPARRGSMWVKTSRSPTAPLADRPRDGPPGKLRHRPMPATSANAPPN